LGYACCFIKVNGILVFMLKIRGLIRAAAGLLCLFFASTAAAETVYDIVVYGGTCSGITAAIQAKRMGKSVILVCPETHLGGLTISGLGWTDTKDTNCIGGLSREFYHRIWLYYNNPAQWVYQTRSSYSVSWQAGSAIQNSTETMWTFEPHAAEEVFEQWLTEEGVTVVRNRWLDRQAGGVVKNGNRITAIKMLSYDPDYGFSPAETYAGKMFIDASYEGDLMASAGVSYRMGRDSRTEYNETLNGICFKSTDLSPANSSYKNIDPYVVPGDPDSGYIPQIEGAFTDMSQIGGEDDRLQSFNFRMCLTDVAANRAAISKPAGYDEKQYELLFRLYEAGQNPGFSSQRMPNLKTDSNNDGLMSLDWPGGNFSMKDGWSYSEASYSERMNIIQRHRDYVQGLLWTMLYHPRVPAGIRSSRTKWGLPKDEFADNQNFPYFAYVREARRMEGEMVMTEHHVKMASGYVVPDSIGQGSYSLDSHVVRRVVIDGAIWDEGSFYLWWSTGYPISYRSILPKQQEAANLLVPVCLSASHAAFGSIRMEPTYMILGQSAATAAALAVDYEYDLQDVPYDLLRTRLLNDGQRLKETFTPSYSSILLNFGAAISDDTNSPAHAIGKVSGTRWNLITADKPTGLVNSEGAAVSVSVNLGKTLPSQKTVQWDRHGFVNSALGSDLNTGIYAGNARSAMYVDDGAGSHVALGVRLAGLEAGIYALYTVAINTNTANDDSYNIYAFSADSGSGQTDFTGKPALLMDNTRQSDAWLFDKNFVSPLVAISKNQDLVVVIEGLTDAAYRAFINSLEIVKVAGSPLAPAVSSGPKSIKVYPAGNPFYEGPAEFSCGFKSLLPPAVRWYKSAAGVNQPVDMNDPDIQVSGPDYDSQHGEYASGLVISNVDKNDGGQYYCVITNSEGESVSQTAELLVRDTLAHWTLDSGDYNGTHHADVSGHLHPVSVSGTPVFTAGADGKANGALLLSSGSGSGTAGTWNPSQETGQISISAWVYWTGGTDTSFIVEKSNAWDAVQMMWTWGINPTTQKINFVSAGSSTFQTSISQTDFQSHQWHHLIVTHDSSSQIAQLYVDTKLISTGTLVMGSKTDAVVRLGADSSGRSFQGRLDDVCIYNYVLDEKGILNAYNGAAALKKNICVLDSDISQFDISGPDGTADCRIDLFDIVQLASVWLSSGLYPSAN
jgi:hypothetical protein